MTIDLLALLPLLHIAALVPGLVFALTADGLALSTLVRPIGPGTWTWMLRLHRLIMVSLILMWATGLALVATKFLPGGPGLTPKLMVKLLTVLVLTVNALAIGRIALPHLRSLRDQNFGTLDLGTRMKLGLIGGISSASWITALALGAVAALKPLGYLALFTILGPVIACGLLAGIIIAALAPWIGRETGPVVGPAVVAGEA